MDSTKYFIHSIQKQLFSLFLINDSLAGEKVRLDFRVCCQVVEGSKLFEAAQALHATGRCRVEIEQHLCRAFGFDISSTYQRSNQI